MTDDLSALRLWANDLAKSVRLHMLAVRGAFATANRLAWRRQTACQNQLKSPNYAIKHFNNLFFPSIEIPASASFK
jgi:hypothetical protein